VSIDIMVAFDPIEREYSQRDADQRTASRATLPRHLVWRAYG
jgi:hypothetical protein